MIPASGNNSVVECDLAKVEVAGSNPVSRSIFLWRHSQVVRQRSAKPLFSGSNPDAASTPHPTSSRNLWLSIERKPKLKLRIFTHIVFFGLILIISGCFGSHEMTGGKTPPPTEKPPENMDNATSGSGGVQKYVPGQVLVKLKQGTNTSALKILARDLGLETLAPLNLPGTYLMKIRGNESVESVVEKLKAYDMVEYGEPNYNLKTE